MWRKRVEIKEDGERIINDLVRAKERTMNRAVKLLSAKPRSVEELRTRLIEKTWTNLQLVDQVLEKLQEYGYLDDAKFAGDLALSKLRQKPQGERRLQQSLSQKLLSKENVDAAIKSAFERMPEAELIDAAIEKRLRLKGKPETREDSKKFYDHLLRQGFDFDLIRAKMGDIAKRRFFEEE